MLYSPKWSKAKKRLMSFLCPSLYAKIDFHIINYRGAHDQLGRAVMTVNKVEKLSMCTILAERALYYKKQELQRAADDDHLENIHALHDAAHQLLKEEGIYAQYDFFAALELYLNAPIEESLKSTDTLIKILCLVDRRVGKCTLRNMQQQIHTEPELVQYFYELRCEAEKLSFRISS